MNFKKITLLSFLFISSQFCFSQNGVTIVDSIISNSIIRKFRLYVPNSYSASQPVPLIINLHGLNSNAIQQQAYSNFMPIADTATFLMVYPEGKTLFGNSYWNAGFGGAENDVLFMSDLIDSLKLNYNIDLNSVYSCGMSNGGIMSYYLACNLPSKITAIASVTGSMLKTWFNCAPARPFPIMEIHGTADATVNYNGAATFAPIDSIVKKWQIHNNCNASPITYTVPDINTTDNSFAINYKYINGTNNSNVELFKIINGSHSWPGAAPIFTNTNQDFNASAEIWRFFKKFKLNQFVSTTNIRESNIDADIRLFPNPVSVQLSIEGCATDSKITITNLVGNVLIKQFYSKGIDVSSLTNGIYFLQIETSNKNASFKFIKN